MQETFGANMLALVNGQPKILSLRDMVYYYLEHQKDVVTRRTRFDLNKALARAHILEGLLKALDHIDEIVSIIRASKDPNTAKTTLMERFDFSDKQAQAILDMRLARPDRSGTRPPPAGIRRFGEGNCPLPGDSGG